MPLHGTNRAEVQVEGSADGTVDRIAKFVSADGLDDSLLHDTGSTLSYNTDKFTVAAASGDTYVKRHLEIDGNLNHDGAGVGFYGAAPVAQQTGVAVTAAAIHAALVALGLITA